MVRGELGGTYEVVADLAPGGMANAYVVRRRGVGLTEFKFALKRMRAGANHREFLSEATVISRLRHDRIVRAYDADKDDQGLCFLVMELVEGVDLAQLLSFYGERGEHMAPGLAIHIATQVLEALEYAHSFVDDDIDVQGIVHRDVTPSNILLDMHGYVKLADFGIAKWKSRETYTRTGAVRGKVPYMSPEHMRREKLDQRADLFSVGATLHEMLSGEIPSDLDEDESSDGPRVPLAKLRLDLPPQLLDLIDKLLAPRRSDRPSTAREVLDMLLTHDIDRRAREHLAEDVTACWVDLQKWTGDQVRSTNTSTSVPSPKRRTAPSTVPATPLLLPKQGRWKAPAAGVLVLLAISISGLALRQRALGGQAAPAKPAATLDAPDETSAMASQPDTTPLSLLVPPPLQRPPLVLPLEASPLSSPTTSADWRAATDPSPNSREKPHNHSRSRRERRLQTGQVRIIVRALNGHAELIDGSNVHRGRSPLVVSDLAPGTYAVRASATRDMEHAVTHSVTVIAGEQTEHYVEMRNPFE